GDADIVAEALGHFSLPVEAHENRHRETNLAFWLVVHIDLRILQLMLDSLFSVDRKLDLAVHKQIALVSGRADLDTGFELHSDAGSPHGLKQLMHGTGRLDLDAR